MSDRNPMKVGVFLYDGFQEVEFWYPVLRLREANVDVVVIGVHNGEAASSLLGYPVVPNLSLSQVKPADFAALILPGGNVAGIAETTAFRSFLEEAQAKGVLLAVSSQANSLVKKPAFAAKTADDVPALMRALVKELKV